MATTTAKLGLRKPAGSDNVNVVTDIADNMQLIDDGFAAIAPAYRNAIRNGDMSVAQRGNGPFTTGSSNTIDGMFLYGMTGFSLSRVALAVGTGEASYAAAFTSTGQAAAGDHTAVALRIENVRKYAGKVVTLSLDAYAASGTPKIAVETSQFFGIGGSPSAAVSTAVGAITISTTRTRYSITFTLPSITGKTLGTTDPDTFNYLELILWFSAGTTYTARSSSIGIQNGTITITDVQLEAGGVATAFERLPQQVQLAWCQRYYVGYEGANNGLMACALYAGSAHGAVFIGGGMRAVPTVTGANLFVRGNSTDAAFTPSGATITGNAVAISGTGTFTNGTSGVLWCNNAAGYLRLSAEL